RKTCRPVANPDAMTTPSSVPEEFRRAHAQLASAHPWFPMKTKSKAGDRMVPAGNAARALSRLCRTGPSMNTPAAKLQNRQDPYLETPSPHAAASEGPL